jgi:hypothetical protein
MPGDLDRAIEDHRRDPKPHPRMGLTDTQLAQINALLVALGSGPLLATTPPPAVAWGVPAAVGSSTFAARADHAHNLTLPQILESLAGVTGAGLLTLNTDGSVSANPPSSDVGNLAVQCRQYAWSVAS